MYLKIFAITQNVLIKNIINYANIEPDVVGSDLELGGLFGKESGLFAKYNIIEDCINYGDINAEYSGGIFSNSSYNGTVGIGIKNCYNFGNINANNSGGIFGPFSINNAYIKGNILVDSKLYFMYECGNYGNINGSFSGGIFAKGAFIAAKLPEANDLPTDGLLISKCFNVGNMNNSFTGGIFAADCLHWLEHALHIEMDFCYNLGSMTQFSNAGLIGDNIFAGNNGFSASFTIRNCFNAGTMNGNDQAGLLYSISDNNPHTINFINCYSSVPSIYQSNYLYKSNTYTNVIITTQNSNYTDSTWNSKNAYQRLTSTNVTNVNSVFNDYNNYTFSAVFTDVSKIGADGLPETNIPFKYTSQLENTNETLTISTPQEVVSLTQTPTGNYYIVSSEIENILNENVYGTFGTMNQTTTEISTISSLKTQSNKKVIIFQTHVITNPITNTTYSETYKILLYELDVTFAPVNPIICMGENTLITIFEKNCEIERPVKLLNEGDLVKTEANEYVPIKHIYKSHVYNVKNEKGQRKKDKLYLFEQKDFPELKQDLIVTGGHPILVNKLSNNEIDRLRKFRLHDRDQRVEENIVLIAFLSDKARDFTTEGLYPIYNLVLEKVNGKDRHPIRINGLLSSSMSVQKYEALVLK